MTRRNALVAMGALAALAAVLVAMRGDDDRPTPGPPTPPRPEREEAVRAATRFLVGLDADTLLDRRARERFVARWAAPDAARRLQRTYAAEAARLAPLAGGVSRAALLGYRLLRFERTAADVAIWAVSLASVGDMPTAVGWRTFLVSATSDEGRWKVTAVRETPGPTLRSSPRSFRAQAARFWEFRVAP